MLLPQVLVTVMEVWPSPPLAQSLCEYGMKIPTLLVTCRMGQQTFLLGTNLRLVSKSDSHVWRCPLHPKLHALRFPTSPYSVSSSWNAGPSCDFWLRGFPCSGHSKACSWGGGKLVCKHLPEMWWLLLTLPLISVAQHSTLCVVVFAGVINFWLFGLCLYQPSLLCSTVLGTEHTFASWPGEGRRFRPGKKQ